MAYSLILLFIKLPNTFKVQQLRENRQFRKIATIIGQRIFFLVKTVLYILFM